MMTKVDENARQYILELETINDLQSAEIEEKDARIKELEEKTLAQSGQIQALLNAQKVNYGVI
jgi:hypothetical protein